MSNKLVVIIGILVVLILLAGNTHRIFPADSDPCQQDMTHLNHISELPMFHCIGHTEYEVAPNKTGLFQIAKWDHIHPWMNLEWHLEQGFTKEHALELIAHNK